MVPTLRGTPRHTVGDTVAATLRHCAHRVVARSEIAASDSIIRAGAVKGTCEYSESRLCPRPDALCTTHCVKGIAMRYAHDCALETLQYSRALHARAIDGIAQMVEMARELVVGWISGVGVVCVRA